MADHNHKRSFYMDRETYDLILEYGRPRGLRPSATLRLLVRERLGIPTESREAAQA